jgi:hypothetical protein
MGEFKAPVEQKNKTAAPVQEAKEASSLGEMEYVDSRASTFQLIQLQAAADDQGKGSRITQLQSKSTQFTGFSRVAQLQAKSYSKVSTTQPSVVQREENKTGLPDGLKSGMESISGMSLSDVKVHRNSDKPAQLQAHAYAQGTDIHLGPGQEKHLPHELGHVVQQKEGRVKPTVQLKGKVNINDDSGLEKEADVLGQKAIQLGSQETAPIQRMGSDEGGFSNVKSVKDKAAMVENKGKVSTIEGATEARRRDQTNLLPHPKEIVGEAKYNEHLKLFEAGASRFETPWIAQKSKDEWGFGRDFKFLTTKGEADKVQQDSQKPKADGDTGIWHMEKEFGAPKGRWADTKLGGQQTNPKHEMVRYDFPHPEKFDLDMAKGTELDAFKEEWVAGGQTLGGMNEAVIKKIDKDKFIAELAKTADPLIVEKTVKFPTTENFKLDGTTLTPNTPDSPTSP